MLVTAFLGLYALLALWDMYGPCAPHPHVNRFREDYKLLNENVKKAVEKIKN